MRKLFTFVLVGLMLIGGLSLGVYADNPDYGENSDHGVASASVTSDVGVDIYTIAAIYLDHSSVTLDPLTSEAVTIDDSSASLDDTILSSDGSDYNVHAYANASYSVTVGLNGEAPDGLNGNLQVSGSDDWGNVIDGGSSATTTVLSGDAGAYNSQAVDYQYIPTLADTPGSYTVTLTYTVSTS